MQNRWNAALDPLLHYCVRTIYVYIYYYYYIVLFGRMMSVVHYNIPIAINLRKRIMYALCCGSLFDNIIIYCTRVYNIYTYISHHISINIDVYDAHAPAWTQYTRMPMCGIHWIRVFSFNSFCIFVLPARAWPVPRESENSDCTTI
jgi:hypothetical protein